MTNFEPHFMAAAKFDLPTSGSKGKDGCDVIKNSDDFRWRFLKINLNHFDKAGSHCTANLLQPATDGCIYPRR